jgi:lipoprotein NlpI/transglutaminase-like putative cysteine protease
MKLCPHALVRRALMAALIVCSLPNAGRAQDPAGNSPFKEVSVAADAFSLGDPVPTWVEPVTIPEPGAVEPIVMRLADAQYLVDRTPVVYVRRAVMINDAASLTSAGQIAIPFVPEYHKVKLHSVRVLRGGESLDRTASSTIRFLQRETSLEQGIYVGEVTASILVKDLRVGDTLEFAYSRHGQNPVFGDKFVDVASWDQGPPTRLRRLVVNHPASRQVLWRISGDSKAKPVTPKETVQDGMRKLVFEERSMAKLDFEPLTPPDYPAYRIIELSEFSGWEDVAAWAGDLFQSKGELNQSLRDVVETLRTKATDEERVVGALEFVQSQIRYFSVSLGESSHRPTQPDVVMERRYGDCKDKSLLLIALLDKLGVESKPVLLHSGRRKGLDGALPSPLHFNHVIVQASVGGNTFYLDPTYLGQHGLLRRMGQLHVGAQVLVVSPQTRHLSTIGSADSADLAHSEIYESAVLPKFDGEAELTVRQVWRGAMAEALRVGHERASRAEIAKGMGNAMEARYQGAKPVGEPDIQDDRVNNVFSTTMRYSVPKFATERDGNWFVRFVPVNMRGALAPAPSSTRAVPLHLPAYPYYAKYTFEVRFPDDVNVASDPRRESVRGKYFTYSVAGSFRGNVAKSTIELKTLADQVKVADLPKYGDDISALGNVAVGVLVVPKGARRPKGTARVAKRDLGQALRKQLQDRIEKSTLAIKSGKLGETDLAGSYCLRSSAHGELGSVREALADANEAVKLTPSSPEAFRCRAYAYLVSGRFEESIADFSKAITLGATDSHTLQRRGIAKLYANKLDSAAEDFARASEMGDATAYADLWVASTYQRLGRPLPEAVIKRAKAEPRGDWPRPALAVMTGNLAPDDMLKLLAGKSGDDRTTALAEAYFYLGQHYLVQGDRAKAREFFEKSRGQNILIYMEHTAAGFELQALGTAAAPGASLEPAQPGAAPQDAAAKKAARKPRKAAPTDWTNDVWK